MLLRNTPAAPWPRLLSSLQRRRDANDQVVFNDVLNAMNGTVVGIEGEASSGSSSSSGKSGGNVRGASKGGGVGSSGVTSSRGAGQGASERSCSIRPSSRGYYFYGSTQAPAQCLESGGSASQLVRTVEESLP